MRLTRKINERTKRVKNFTNWQKASVDAIYRGLLEYEAKNLCLGELADVDKRKRWISRNFYPFGLRENHPYKVWLDELNMAERFMRLGLPVRVYPYYRENSRIP